MIQVINLTKKYGSNLAVDNISFTIESGKIYGFLGPNGAGKSTTMNIITGCLAPTSGEVLIDGHSIVTEPVEAKAHIGYLPELPPLYTDMTPLEYLTFVAEAKGVRRDKIDEEVNFVMEKTDITHVCRRLIRNLSKGYRQRVGVAQAMLGDPDVIILDEPTVGLDPQQIIEIRDLIKSLGEDRTVILSSHILTEVSSVCDHLIVISGGKLVANDTMGNISRSLQTEITMDITVKASENEVSAVLSSIGEITSWQITSANAESTSAKIKYPTELDLRETVSFAFSDIRRAVLSMSVEEDGLEEIFLKLTDSGSGAVKNGAEEDEESEDDVEDEEYGDDEGADEFDDDEEYIVYDPKDYLGDNIKVDLGNADDTGEVEEADDGGAVENGAENGADDDNGTDNGDDDYKPLFGGK